MLSRSAGLGVSRGGGVGPKPATVLRGGGTYPVPGAGGTMPAVASHLPTVPGCSRMREGSGGVRLGGGFPLRTGRAPGGQEEIAGRRLGFFARFVSNLVNQVSGVPAPPIHPPPSSPI